MESCTVETGFLRKKPCPQPAVTHCLNCERALCAEHAVPEMSAAGRRTGNFICEECKAALKDHDKRLAEVEKKAPAAAKPPAPGAAPKAAAAPETPKPPEHKPGGGGLDFQ